MAAKDPAPYLPWLVGRASGIVALGLVTVAVLLGLTMSAKLLRKPGIGRTLMRLHEHIALVGLGAIVVHGLALFADPWLRPGVSGVTIPFTMSYKPAFTGLGIVAGYLAALLGLSFYARRRIGVKLWRKLHRATVLVWVLGVVHTLGAGSDAATQWLRAFTLLPAVPIVYLLARRMLPGARPAARRVPTAAAPSEAAPAQDAVAASPRSRRGETRQPRRGGAPTIARHRPALAEEATS